MINKNILLTNAGTATAVAVMRALYGQVSNIYAVDMNSFCFAKHFLGEKLLTVPPFAKTEEYKTRLLEICKEKDINYIIPCSNDDELIFFSENFDDFVKLGARPIISNLDTIRICDDKYKTTKYMQKLGFQIPSTYLPEDLSKKQKNVGFPLILKSRSGNGAANVHRIPDQEHLTFYLNKVPNAMIQECINGEEYTIDTMSDLNGKVLVSLCRRRVSVKSGISVKAEFIENSDYISKVKKILESLTVIGPCNTQVIDGRFIEINPRFSGGLGLSIAAGINLPLLCIKLFEGMPIKEKDLVYKKGSKVIRFWDEVVLGGE